MIGVTNHAVEQYVRRVKPHIGATQARRELYALLEFAAEIERPYWDLSKTRHAADGYLLIAPDVAAIVRDGAVVTVITKDLAVELARQKRREIKRAREQKAAAERAARRDRTYFKKGRPMRGNRPRPRIGDEV